MSAPLTSRLRAALPALGLAFAVRVACACALAVAPARWASSTTRGFPRGELALVDHGAGLLLEVLQRRQVQLGLMPTAPVVAVLGGVAALVTFGALVAALARPQALSSSLVHAGRRMGSLLLVSGLGALALSLVALLEALALMSALATASRQAALVAGALALLPLACVACLVDAAKVAAITSPEGGVAALRLAARGVRRGFVALLASYLVLALGELLVATAGALAVAGLAFGSPLAVLLATACALLALAALTLARAWFLAGLVPRFENAPLHGATDLRYVSAPPSADPPR